MSILPRFSYLFPLLYNKNPYMQIFLFSKTSWFIDSVMMPSYVSSINFYSGFQK